MKSDSGTYAWASLFQQHPAPDTGVIFNPNWWRYWTTDPQKATDDGRVVLLPEEAELKKGFWADSWDFTFGATHNLGDYVVGQRWVQYKANKYLIAQKRGRWTFTESIKQMKEWGVKNDSSISPFGYLVNQRLVENKANGAAIIETLKESVDGIKPINPTTSKEGRARAITPTVESGNVILPHPREPGYSWVNDFLSEIQNFPNDAHDDQVDCLTQFLLEVKDKDAKGMITIPSQPTAVSRQGNMLSRSIGRANRTALR